MASCSKPSEWREIIRNEALRIGFDACGFARVEEVDVDMRDSYRQWLASGKQAQMGYLDNYVELRDNPALLYPGARTTICGTQLLSGSLSVRWKSPVRLLCLWSGLSRCDAG